MVRLHQRSGDSHHDGNRQYNSTGTQDRRELWMFKYLMEHHKYLDIRDNTGCTDIRDCHTGQRNDDMCRV